MKIEVCRCWLCNTPGYSGLVFGHCGGRRDTMDLHDLMFDRGCKVMEVVDGEVVDIVPSRPMEETDVRCHACLGTGYWVLVLEGPMY